MFKPCYNKAMKKVLAFDIDQTLNVAKTPITDDIAELLLACLNHFEICPISGQKFDQFLIQIVNRLPNPTPEQLSHLHLFVAQGTQYYRYNTEKKDWEQVYNNPLTDEQVAKITSTIEQAAKELGYWEEDKLAPGDEIIENRLSQVTFSALGQKAGTEAKYAWDPDCKKRNQIAARCKELSPEFEYEVAGTTSLQASGSRVTWPSQAATTTLSSKWASTLSLFAATKTPRSLFVVSLVLSTNQSYHNLTKQILVT